MRADFTMTLTDDFSKHNAVSPMGMVLTVENSEEFVDELTTLLEVAVPQGTSNPAASIEDADEEET